jgi:Na+-transporting NADH:ubiquinone oxidoreductase subunit C
MVILVAAALSFTNGALKEKQAKNSDLEKMMQILRSVKVEVGMNEAEAIFQKTIKSIYTIDSKGEIITKDPGKTFLVNVAKEVAKPVEERRLPVFEAMVEGRKKYILPVYGSGLWGPIWGYVSLNEDKKTIFAASFSHKGETPGLGAEIDTKDFQRQFEGKEIIKDQLFKSIGVLKAGQSAKNQDAVDGISGGTITSKGLEAMLQNSLVAYKSFLNAQ